MFDLCYARFIDGESRLICDEDGRRCARRKRDLVGNRGSEDGQTDKAGNSTPVRSLTLGNSTLELTYADADGDGPNLSIKWHAGLDFARR